MASRLPILLLVLCSLALTEAQVRLYKLRAKNLPANILGTTDGYVKVFCGSASLGKTSVRNNERNPWWGEEFTYFNAAENDMLKLEVRDSNFLLDGLVGVCERQLQQGDHSHDCYLKKGGTLHYSYTLG